MYAQGVADFTALVEVRERHETTYAAKSVRSEFKRKANTDGAAPLESVPTPPTQEQPLQKRRELLKQLSDTMKQYSANSDSKGPTSGLARDSRWTGQQRSGNTENAAIVGLQRARTVRPDS